MHDFALLLIQLLVILAAARTCGWLFESGRQPRVLGEMTAGILLGPTVLGALAPSVLSSLFPATSLSLLSGLSQIGLVLYMFYVGLELDTAVLRALRTTAAVVSVSGIIVPFTLGILLAWHIQDAFKPAGISTLTFSLFVGVAMGITAFPVLVRILKGQNLISTPLGILAVASAAIDDVTSWCLLAAIVALAHSASTVAVLLRIVILLIAFLTIMLGAVRPTLRHLAERGWLPLSAAYLIPIASAAFTEAIGVHALFGAFVAGIIFPRKHRSSLEDQILPLSQIFLPLFFAFSGLRTAIPFRGGLAIWGYGVLILLVAIIGKFGACALAARCTGLNWRDAASLGTLMNTRGLVELVILNIGSTLESSPRPCSRYLCLWLY